MPYTFFDDLFNPPKPDTDDSHPIDKLLTETIENPACKEQAEPKEKGPEKQ